MNENISQQFKFFGLNAINFSIVFSVFLITWGIIVSVASGSNSITSLIPTFLGIPIFILSLLSKIFPKSQKILMHIVIIFGLITSVIIYYLYNYFYVLGLTEKINVNLSILLPLFILLIAVYLISNLALRENMDEFDKALSNINNIDNVK